MLPLVLLAHQYKPAQVISLHCGKLSESLEDINVDGSLSTFTYCMVQLLLLFVLLPLLAELKAVAVLHPLVDGLQVNAVFATKVIPPFWLV